MSAIGDRDDDIAIDSHTEEDVAPSSGGFGFVKTKKLTSEESASHAVVNALKARLDEYIKEVNTLRKKENEYNELKVDYARLDEKVKVYSKASVFWDIVLILCPLAIGYLLNQEFIECVSGMMVVAALCTLIIAALLTRYIGFSSKEK